MKQYVLGSLLALMTWHSHGQQDITLEQDLRPVWEVGAFAAVFNAPVYPAANQNETNIIAAPYFIYRGKVLRVGEGSIARAVAVDKKGYELDLSLAASFGSNSDDNPTREDMPDLDFLFEVGPQLRLMLGQFEFKHQGKSELFFNLQARAAFSTNFSGIQHRGYVFQPQLAYRQRGWLSEKTALAIRISPVWASEQLHDYFYQVDSAFITSQRPSFDAKSGYLGTNIGLSMSFDATQDLRMFVGGRVSLHSGAANKNSPLFRETSNVSIAIGMVWRLWQSESKVSGR